MCFLRMNFDIFLLVAKVDIETWRNMLVVPCIAEYSLTHQITIQRHFTEIVVSEDRTEYYLNGKRHRIDGPAVVHTNGDKAWWLNGKFHHIDGPAIDHVNGYKVWYLNGNLHCVDGPAVIQSSGNKDWYLNGKRHRVGGPATVNVNGFKVWYQNGEKHRVSGPAVKRSDGYREYYRNRKQIGSGYVKKKTKVIPRKNEFEIINRLIL